MNAAALKCSISDKEGAPFTVYPNTTKAECNVEHLGEVIIDRARSGKPIFDYQLDVLSKEQREEVLSLLEQYGTQVVETK